MRATFKRCVTDEDFAQVSLFLLARKYDLHPAFSTLEMVSLIYAHITQGQIHQAVLPDGRVVGAAAYYQGTPEADHADRSTALIDIVMLDEAYRGTRLFLSALAYLSDWIGATQPEIDEVRFTALTDNGYLCKLYAKLAPPVAKQEGPHGELTVFSDHIYKIRDILDKFRRV